MLYLVATPIGNLEDITLRALRVLKEVDLIIAEDTRHSKQLLRHYGIDTKLDTSLYKGVEAARVSRIIERLRSGLKIALISDAGTPLISDPGYLLVREAVEASISMEAIPGPTAAITALILSGFHTDRFIFDGSPPKSKQQKLAYFESIKTETRTAILYESPHRILDTLRVVAQVMPQRQIALCRELTKLHEEVLRGCAHDILRLLESRERIKGEITLVMEGARDKPEVKTNVDIAERVQELIGQGLDKKTAMKDVAKTLAIPKREVYEKLLRGR